MEGGVWAGGVEGWGGVGGWGGCGWGVEGVGVRTSVFLGIFVD